MFLLDNQLVRKDWGQAKALVTGLVEKHGGTVRTARHWEERRLAYAIKKRNRATYLLTYCDLQTETIPQLSRDLELSEQVLRYLITSAKEIPEKEGELTRNETSADFVLPEPPADDHSDEPEPERERERERSRRSDSDSDDSSSDDDSESGDAEASSDDEEPRKKARSKASDDDEEEEEEN